MSSVGAQGNSVKQTLSYENAKKDSLLSEGYSAPPPSSESLAHLFAAVL